MKASDLREEYRQAIASPLIISEIDFQDGSPFVLFNNDWVRILCVRKADSLVNAIEVELSISAIGGTNQLNPQETISTLIAYLNYILQLHEHGFILETMEDDVLWTAVIEVASEPDIEFFEILLPPKIN